MANHPCWKPRYTHDCSSCLFLQCYKEYDLYFCPRSAPSCLGGSVIARESSEASDYFSEDIGVLIPAALNELAFGLKDFREDGSSETIPPRMGSPLHVAISMVFSRQLTSLKFEPNNTLQDLWR